MKRIAMTSVMFAFAALVTTPAQAEPPSYPLLCHGGPSMRIVENHDVNGAGIPGATAMFVYFRQGTAPGSAHAPGSGECTWMDRTLNDGGHPNEPLVFWIKSSNIQFAFQVMGSGQIVRDTTGPRLNVEGSTISLEAHDWETIVRSVMTGEIFTVNVYNSNGVMVVTHVGP